MDEYSINSDLKSNLESVITDNQSYQLKENFISPESKKYLQKEWLPICNSDGFMYFYNKKSGECQHTFPKYYDPVTKKYNNI